MPHERPSKIKALWAQLKKKVSDQNILGFSQVSIIENDLPGSKGAVIYYALCDVRTDGLSEYVLDAGVFMCIHHKGHARDIVKSLQDIGPDQFKKVTRAQEIFLYPENYAPDKSDCIIKYLLPVS